MVKNLTEGRPLNLLFFFALPMVAGNLFQQLYNMVDTAVVGKFVGEDAVAAVGSSFPIVFLSVAVASGLSMGCTVVVSQLFGAGRIHEMKTTISTAIISLGVLGLLIMGLGTLLAGPLLQLLGTDPDIMADSRTYLQIYFGGAVFLFLYNTLNGIYNAQGDSKTPLIFLMISSLTNIVLDLLFVICFHMGVAGVAYATIIAQAASAVLVLYVLTKENASFGLRWNKLHIDGRTMKEILIIGLPASIQQGLTSFSNVFVQAYINDLGDLSASGWAAYNRIDMFLMVPTTAIGQASTTFVAQNWGAQQPERARKGVRTGILLSLGCMGVCAVGVILLARPLLSIISPSEAVISFGARFLYIITPFYLVISFNQMYAGALRGIGESVVPTVIMLFSFVVFRQIYLYLATTMIADEQLRFVIVALAYPVGWMLCSALEAIAYHRSRLFHPALKKAEA